MGFYDVDYSNATSDPVTPGIYEVFVCDYSIVVAKTGNTVVNLFYKVRSDVQQEHQNGLLNYDRFIEVEAARWRFNNAAAAAGIPDGTIIADSESWATFMVNKNLKVKVGMGKPNAKGDSYPEVKSFYPSDFPHDQRQQPILSHAYESQHMTSAVQSIAGAAPQAPRNGQEAMQRQYQGGQNTTPAHQSYSPPRQEMPDPFQPPNSSRQQNQGQPQGQAQSQPYNQQLLTGVDPLPPKNTGNTNFNQSFSSTNGKIADEDLPF